MADIHTLPMAALPEGWEDCRNGFWRRFGRRRKQLLVMGDAQADHTLPFRGFIGACSDNSRVVGDFASLAEAIAAVESAYCGCRVRGVQGG